MRNPVKRFVFVVLLPLILLAVLGAIMNHWLGISTRVAGLVLIAGLIGWVTVWGPRLDQRLASARTNG